MQELTFAEGIMVITTCIAAGGLILVLIELLLLKRQTKIAAMSNSITAELEILEMLNEYGDDFHKIENQDLEDEQKLRDKTIYLIRILNTLETAFSFMKHKIFNAEEFYNKLGGINLYYLGYLYYLFHKAKSKEKPGIVPHFDQFKSLEEYLSVYFRTSLCPFYEIFKDIMGEDLKPVKSFEEIYAIFKSHIIDKESRGQIIEKIKKLQKRR